LVPPPDDDHDCGWKAYAKAQEARFEKQLEINKALLERLESVEHRLAGHKSEKRKATKLPPPVPKTPTRPEEAAPSLRETVETELVPVPLPPEQCTCPKCGSTEMRAVGSGTPSTVYEYVQPHFRRRIFVRETRSCRCGHIVTAAAPPRVGEGTRYSPSFVAHLVVSKCNESMAQYRLSKSYRQLGIPIARSTMCDLFHRAARELRPLHAAALALVPAAGLVHADETSIRQQGLGKSAFLWTFVTGDVVAYEYATTRSGSVPQKILGDSTGYLVVDQYTGYNAVTAPGRRVRVGCFAHVRRKLHEQLERHPELAVGLDMIGGLYAIEHELIEAKQRGSPLHLEARHARARPLLATLLRWARHHRRLHEPRSAVGRALRYLLGNFRELTRFTRDAQIPLDNNVAESSLRRIALGRKNYLFAGSEDAGHDLACLYTLVASCEKHGVNPLAYLTDVLVRVQEHPESRVADLLPHRWKLRAPT
jgi:transposase